MLLQVAVSLAGLVHERTQLCQSQFVILVGVCRLKQLIRVVQCLGLQTHAHPLQAAVTELEWVQQFGHAREMSMEEDQYDKLHGLT